MRFLSLLAAAASVAGVATANTHVLHEKRHATPRKWVRRDDLAGNRVLPMRIGLKQSNLDKGHEMLMDISRYSQWYSEEDIVDLFAPPQNSVDVVRDWLEKAGVAAERITLSANKQWIQFDAPVAEAEQLLKTKYHNFEHVDSGIVQISCDEYSLPGHIQEHVDYVQPGLRLMAGGKIHTDGLKKRATNPVEARGFRAKGNSKFSGPIFGTVVLEDSEGLSNLVGTKELSSCDTKITPPCIEALYNITSPTKAAKGNELGIFEEGDFYTAVDMAEFFTRFAPNIPPTTQPILRGINGASAPGLHANGESDLDFQVSYPIIYPQQAVLFQTDDRIRSQQLRVGTGFLNTFFDAIDGSYCTFSAYGETGDAKIDPKYPDLDPQGYKGHRQCGKYKPTNVISISYGEQEDDLPTNYQRRQCAEVMKLGMQGVTIVLASGDSGVAARSSDDGNWNGCLGPKGTVFNPGFPVSCPYLTAVGSTFVPEGASAARAEEVATTRFGSGGGFSNIYPRPLYQIGAVSQYLALYDPGYTSYSTVGTNRPSDATTKNGAFVFNRAGRGYPDLSAVGDNVLIVKNAKTTLVGGTSASAPVVAAIITRINEERLAVGKRPVGFINPTLYANPHAFHDIIKGNNSGCGTPGFKAVPGWDPVTGLGTPNYPALLKVFMALP